MSAGGGEDGYALRAGAVAAVWSSGWFVCVVVKTATDRLYCWGLLSPSPRSWCREMLGRLGSVGTYLFLPVARLWQRYEGTYARC